MKNKIFGRINLWNVFLIVSISFFCWVLLRAILPNYPPNLMSPFNLCDTFNILEITPSNRKDIRTFKCKTRILLDVLFRAKTVYVSILSNQEASMTVSLRRRGSGGMHSEPKIILPKSVIGSMLAFDLDQINNPKINWLVGDYDEVIFEINNFKSLDNMNISIQEVYLK